MYIQSGVYQLKYNECPLRYVGQTERTFKAQYREHIQAIKTNKQTSKQTSKYAQRIFCNTIEEAVEVL
jgi:hypothetical protein